ncbi:MAG: 16S rRNA (cytidine(1402)-2'-O)-methyltransferase [Candidatus Izemoplasmatales bacterium]|nr:16S rRNA (cytidine(1402)-2'-O)-methyltransferase [Candidatus Izemoplasmatales bacterium]
MERHFNYRNDKATLYLISTPIGNLDDITFRAVKIMKEVPILLAEDTRVSQKLLHHFDIDKPLQSFHEHNEYQKADSVLTELSKGNDVGLMSDAGMPLFSDPGSSLVQKALAAGYNVVCLPGANAAVTGLLMSGINATPFYFAGFPERKASKRRMQLESLKYRQETLVFYEAPHRIESFLKDMLDIFGDRFGVILREISKAYVEVIRGKLSELSTLADWKGELVVVVAGTLPEKVDFSGSLVDQVDYFINEGYSKTSAMKKVTEMTGIPKNEIYREYLDKTKKQ